MKQAFFCKLFPPRPAFPADMTEDERTTMFRHIEYWTALLHKGIAIVFGPVADPKGAFGMAVVSVENEDELKKIFEGDPAQAIGMKLEHYPMPQAVFKKD